MLPHRLQPRVNAVLPIDFANPTWQILDWDRTQSTAQSLALHARQLHRRDEDLEETALSKMRRLLTQICLKNFA
jgi:hypothetical protein